MDQDIFAVLLLELHQVPAISVVIERQTILYALLRRFVIHLTPVSLGKKRTKEYPIDFLDDADKINLASSFHQIRQPGEDL